MPSHNIFEQRSEERQATEFGVRSQRFLIEEAKVAGSLRGAILAHTAVMDDGSSDVPGLDNYLSHGVTVDTPEGFYDTQYPDIGFPDYKRVPGEMPWINIRSGWVTDLLSSVSKSPFTYVKNMMVDIRGEEARARGYLKGNFKHESFIEMLERRTSPCTYFIKQHLEEEDIADITEFNVVEMCRRAMQIKSDEELARAILVGDGRDKLLPNGDKNPDKILEDCIRPIISDNEYFVISGEVDTLDEAVDAVLSLKENYRGSGNLTAWMNYADWATLMTKRDTLGHRLYHTPADLAAEMGAKKLVDVPFIPQGTILLVDPADYMLGNNKRMNNSWFQQFDINFNKQLMLLENRKSGALIRPFSAIKVEVDSE